MSKLSTPSRSAVTTRTCVLWVDTIVRGQFLDGVEVSLDDAKENVEVTSKLTGGKKMPVLVDLRKLRAQSTDARAYLAGAEATRVTKAVALLIGSPLSRMIGNFYLGYNRPQVPTRLFTVEAEAEAWLMTFVERHDDGG